MYDNQIPVLAYALIGITTLVLTYATINDNEVPTKSSTTSSSSITSMLPNLNVFSSSPAKPVVAEPVVENPMPTTPTLGGKRSKHKHNKNKKTKRNRK